MTIFDIKPMSYWRRVYTNARAVCEDTPRTVVEVDMLVRINRRLIADRDLAIEQLDATNQRRGEEWHRMSQRLTEACDLAAERGRQLQWARQEIAFLHQALRNLQNGAESHETTPASTNTPANGANAELGGILPATREGNVDEPTR